ncbi:MAG: hypothetical protein ACPHW3_08455 [Candidatus Puniceispirillales bacterium]
MYIAVTGLKPRGIIGAIRFWLLAIPSFNQAKSSNGILFCEAKSVNGYKHTLTAWNSKESMNDFVFSKTHVKAIKAYPKIAKGFTVTYESDAVPSWEDALAKWERDAE